METLTQTSPNAVQAGAGQGYTPGKGDESSVVGNTGTSANATVLGGAFDELKDAGPVGPGEKEIQSPDISKPEIEPGKLEIPEIPQPLGDPGYEQNDDDKDGSVHSEQAKLGEQEGYNEVPVNAPIQQKEQLAYPSGTEETEDYPR